MTKTRLVTVTLLAVVAGTLWTLRHQAWQRRQAAKRHDAKPERVQTWESEGGALPTRVGQGGSHPTLPAQR